MLEQEALAPEALSMGRLRHRMAPGCAYFVTTKAHDNRSLFQVTENAEVVVEVLLRNRSAGAYSLHEFVLMPNHLHVLLTPGPTTTLERAMQLIKGGVSYEIHKRRGHRMEIWQAGFHERSIRDAEDFRNKTQYIRENPVKAKLVEKAEEWLYSSAHPRFHLDPKPFESASGAKAPLLQDVYVGAKAPTPCWIGNSKVESAQVKSPRAESARSENAKAENSRAESDYTRVWMER
jgi:putative transposase